jgi:hypothetical protein
LDLLSSRVSKHSPSPKANYVIDDRSSVLLFHADWIAVQKLLILNFQIVDFKHLDK